MFTHQKFIKAFCIIGSLIILLRCSQKEEIDNIGFTFKHSMRIPFNEVKIWFYKTNDGKDAFITVHTRPKYDDPEFNYSRIDTIYDFGIDRFNHLIEKVRLLNKLDLNKAELSGGDGYTYKIEFGAKGKNISYKFWCPDTEKDERGLNEFNDLCSEIIISGKLNENQIR